METTRLADSPSKTTKQIRLHDGRLLAYAEYGDPAGRPVIFFHGTPGSRLFHYPDESIAQSLGVRIITQTGQALDFPISSPVARCWTGRTMSWNWLTLFRSTDLLSQESQKGHHM
jgi:hypothetical protein